jgi:segregation and condensation protein B
MVDEEELPDGRIAELQKVEGQEGLSGQEGQEGQEGLAGPEGLEGPEGQEGERLRPRRAEDEEIRGEVSASVRAGGGAPAPVEDEDALPQRGSAELKAILEALIFASPEPLTPKAIYKILDTEPKEDVQAALQALKQDYDRPGGLQLVDVAGGYQIVTRQDLHEWVRRLFHERTTQKLSVQALETLAVIAYKQPLTALEIGEVRGVNTSGVLNTLLERHLIKIVGRKQVVGRPFMYATTKEFLIRFGLNDLAELPKVEDMAEALALEGGASGGGGATPLLVERTPAEERLPLEEPDPEGPPDETPGGSVH